MEIYLLKLNFIIIGDMNNFNFMPLIAKHWHLKHISEFLHFTKIQEIA
jgi:hypothetical protein